MITQLKSGNTILAKPDKPKTTIHDLPLEIFQAIVAQVRPYDAARLGSTCKGMRDAIDSLTSKQLDTINKNNKGNINIYVLRILTGKGVRSKKIRGSLEALFPEIRYLIMQNLDRKDIFSLKL